MTLRPFLTPFLRPFGNKETTIKRLRAGASNKSDLGGVLQTNNIHIATCDAGEVTKTLTALKASPATAKAKVKFILATDGVDLEAEDLTSGETVACSYQTFPDRFGFFLPLAGISTVKQISENAFRGIELRDFPAEIARLALVIAEFQCDVLYRGHRLALAEFLPLDKQNWITCGNALRLDWVSICPPRGAGVKLQADDLFSTPLNQAQIDFENEGGETYICGNPPYKGSQTQTEEQTSDLKAVFDWRTKNWKSLDYVSGWLMKAADYGTKTSAVAAFVATNSICQGRQVDALWSLIFSAGYELAFAHGSFKWANLASHNAGVTVVIVGISNQAGRSKLLFSEADDAGITVKAVENINAYLVPGRNVMVSPRSSPFVNLDEMSFGNMPNDGGCLLLDMDQARKPIRDHGVEQEFIRPFVGSQEFINGLESRCIWVRAADSQIANRNLWLANRFEEIREKRRASTRPTTVKLANVPFSFGEVRQTGAERVIVVPIHSSESRAYLPVGLIPPGGIISNAAIRPL